MITKSDSIKELATALAKTQGKLEHAAKSSTNPHFNSRYADLAELLNAVRPALSKHGLSVTQHPAYEDGIVSVETLLMHTSGEWISSTLSSPVFKADAQGIGSATTYCRRYSLAAIIGISQADDDGNAASGKGATPAEERPAVNLNPDILSALDAAATAEDWKAVWNKIPVGVRHGYAEAKEKARAKYAKKDTV